MSDELETGSLAVLLLFCRVSGCLLLAPGLSSPRVPVHVRLFIAVAISASLLPFLLAEMLQHLSAIPQEGRIVLVFEETAVGFLIGLLARCFFMALQFAATAISNFIGLAGIPGIPLEESDTGSPLATLASSAAIAVIFVMGLHIELLRALMDSYAVFPLGIAGSAEVFLLALLNTLSETWILALRLSGPFLVYGVIVNFALGFGNRFAQQISMYHTTSGAVMLGGFLLFYLVWVDWLMAFTSAYRAWLLEGGF